MGNARGNGRFGLPRTVKRRAVVYLCRYFGVLGTIADRLLSGERSCGNVDCHAVMRKLDAVPNGEINTHVLRAIEE